MNLNSFRHIIIQPVFLLVIIVLVFNWGGMAQAQDFTLKRSIPVKASYMCIDELGYIYLVDKNRLSKMGWEGTLMFTYSNLTSGDITTTDAGNPFKLLLFFMDFGNIEFLDNTLSLSNTISLNIFGLELSTLAALSYNNGFWVFNPQNLELIRIDQFLQISDRTGNIHQVTGKSINPNFLLEKDDMVFLNDPEHGIMMFDKYGAYYKTINVKGLDYIQSFDKKLVFFQDGKMTILDPATLEEISFTLPDTDYKMLAVLLGKDEKKLYYLGDGVLKIYVLNKSL
ncbi:MAG: hypothetical protein U9R60_00995 [Bacteroidota bacterium]|nr:hypothetical protein [Bacteroidota bacterium]